MIGSTLRIGSKQYIQSLVPTKLATFQWSVRTKFNIHTINLNLPRTVPSLCSPSCGGEWNHSLSMTGRKKSQCRLLLLMFLTNRMIQLCWLTLFSRERWPLCDLLSQKYFVEGYSYDLAFSLNSSQWIRPSETWHYSILNIWIKILEKMCPTTMENPRSPSVWDVRTRIARTDWLTLPLFSSMYHGKRQKPFDRIKSILVTPFSKWTASR